MEMIGDRHVFCKRSHSMGSIGRIDLFKITLSASICCRPIGCTTSPASIFTSTQGFFNC